MLDINLKKRWTNFLRWQTPVEVIAEGKFDSNSIKWSRELNSTKGRTTTVNTKTIKNIADKLQREVENNQVCPIAVALLLWYRALMVSKKRYK